MSTQHSPNSPTLSTTQCGVENHKDETVPRKSLSPPISPSSPTRSPRPGTYPAHVNPAVQAYHQNLSSHLHSLMISSGGAPTTIGTGLAPPAIIQVHDRARGQAGDDAVGEGSGRTRTFSGNASYSSGGIPGLEGLGFMEPEESINPETDDDGEEVEEELPDFTVRPELIPRRSLLHVPSREEVSSSSSASGGEQSRKHEAGLAASREQELKTAWQADGKKVWRTMPNGFTLKMGEEAEDGSGSRMKRKSKERLRVPGIGLGIGMISDDSEIGFSRDEGGTSTQNNGSMYSQSPNLPTISSFGGNSQPHSRSISRQSTSKEAMSEKEIYEAKRNSRLERKRGELVKKVESWKEVVHDESTDEENEEIFRSKLEATIPSPQPTFPSTNLSDSFYGHKPASVTPTPSYLSLPFSAGKSQTFSTKSVKPMYIIPPTPDRETPPILKRDNSGTSRSTSPPSGSGAIDLQSRLRILEALMGTTPIPPVRPPHAESFFLDDPNQLGNPIIQGRRISDDENAAILGGTEEQMETPRPGQRGVMK